MLEIICWAYNFKTLHAIEADNYFPAAFYTLVWERKNFQNIKRKKKLRFGGLLEMETERGE